MIENKLRKRDKRRGNGRNHAGLEKKIKGKKKRSPRERGDIEGFFEK